MKYTFFVDESGDAGIAKVRTSSSGGASPYMVLGGVILENSSAERIKKSLSNIRDEIGKDRLHCSDLNHQQLTSFARTIAHEDMYLFGVISLKETLGYYKRKIESDSKRYYNKCVQYLLERVGHFMEARGIKAENLDIVFEKANVNYDAMKNLISTCQSNPQRLNTKKLRHIDVDRISSCTKNEEPLLQIADLVAHALYKCVDKQPKNYEIPEPRYLKELSARFFGNPKTGRVVGAGIYCVHATSDLKLDKDVKDFLDNLTVKLAPLKKDLRVE